MGQAIRARGWDKKITKVVGFDARGFIYGPLIAQEIGAGFVNFVGLIAIGDAEKEGKIAGSED